MNIWFRIDNKLITPSLSDSILSGITRDSIITLAKDNGIDVEERKIKVSEILESYKKGKLKALELELLVTVNPINSITIHNECLYLNNQEDSYALKLKTSTRNTKR